MSSYQVHLIGTEEKDELYEKYESRLLYTRKADIYGCCIKLLTELEQVEKRWEDNFYSISESIRSHGRLIVIKGPNEPLIVKYDPYTKTAFLVNVDYYGWLKSIALAVASDVLEDEHRIYSVHGAAIDVGGLGVSFIAPSGTGKTTHSWGLMQNQNARLISDDWYFVRLSSREPLAFNSEKNCYIEAGIGKIWNEYERLVDKAQLDERGRAIVNVRWIVGNGGVIPMATIQKIILLKRDPSDKNIVKQLNAEEAVKFLTEHDFCNPYQLVKGKRKIILRTNFFRRFLEQTDNYLVNTSGTPQDTQNEIRKIISVKNRF